MQAHEGTRLSKEIRETELLCVISGKLRVTTQMAEGHVVDCGHMLLLPPNTRVQAEVVSNSYLMVFVVDKPVQLCDLCPLESLTSSLPEEEMAGMPSMLKFNRQLDDYFESFRNCLDEGLMCAHYLEIKSRELMFLLRGFYPRSELALFFRPLISNDTDFSDFILRNYRNVKTVEELARLSNYSRSGFKAHFRKTFGKSTSAWLREKKAHNVHHELTATSKPLQQISKEYNFSSVSHMSIFCKEYFGMPPGKIRREAGKKSSTSARFGPERGEEKLPRPQLIIDKIE